MIKEKHIEYFYSALHMAVFQDTVVDFNFNGEGGGGSNNENDKGGLNNRKFCTQRLEKNRKNVNG